MSGSIDLADVGGTPQTLTGDMVKELLGIQKEQLATAWVKFTGSTGAIVDSYNIASITRTATGKYTVAFTAAMDTADFLVTGNMLAPIGGNTVAQVTIDSTTPPTTTGCNVYTYYVNAANNRTFQDYDAVFVVFYGGKA